MEDTLRRVQALMRAGAETVQIEELDYSNRELIRWLLRDAEANGGGIASTALTGMLLLYGPPQEIRSEIRSAIKKGGRILDEDLIFSLARHAGQPMALRVLGSTAMMDAPRPLFAKLFESFVPEIERCSSEERLIIASVLLVRTNGRSEEADTYARQIRALLFNANLDVAGDIAPAIRKLSRVTSEDIARLLAIAGRASTRMTAVSTLAFILEIGTFPVEDLDQRFWRRIARLAADEDEWVRFGVARILAMRYHYRDGLRPRRARARR